MDFELINELNNWRCDNSHIDKIRAVSITFTIFVFYLVQFLV